MTEFGIRKSNRKSDVSISMHDGDAWLYLYCYMQVPADIAKTEEDLSEYEPNWDDVRACWETAIRDEFALFRAEHPGQRLNK